MVLNWGAFQGEVFEPGLHFKVPFKQRIVKVNVQNQNIDVEKSQAYSKDLQLVEIHSVINYNIKPEGVGSFYSQYNAEFNNVLAPRLEAALKQVVAKYTAEELLNKRGEVQEQVRLVFSQNLPDVVNLVSYSLVNEDFSDAFESAIEKKQVAQQDAERAENELKQVKVEAEQRVAQATAEAEAIKIQAQAITQQGGRDYVQLKAIEKWNGQLPNQMIPGATVPFLDLQK